MGNGSFGNVSVVCRIINRVGANVRSFSYLFPDTLELVLYLALLAYFAVQVAQQQT